MTYVDHLPLRESTIIEAHIGNTNVHNSDDFHNNKKTKISIELICAN